MNTLPIRHRKENQAVILAVALHRLHRWRRQVLNRSVIAGLDSHLRADIGLPPGPNAPWVTESPRPGALLRL